MRRTVAIAGWLVVGLGAVLGVVASVGASPVDPLLGFMALGVLVAAPGALVLIGLRGRNDLWLAAGIAALPLAFLSFAGLTLPLLPASILFVVAWIGHPNLAARPRMHPGIVTPLIVILLLFAAGALFTHEDPASWTTATGGGSTSDVITNREALISIGGTVLALAAGWVLTRPETRSRPRRS